MIGGDAQAEIFQYIDSMRDVAVVWLLVWFALRFIRLIEEHYIASHSEERSVDQTTASAVGKLLRATVAITGTLLVLAGIWGVGIWCVGLWRHWRYRHRFRSQRFIGQFLWRSNDLFRSAFFSGGLGALA